ncbi:XRE family transcriptional regulator [Novosphingobium sediminis]|uniref:XRE family transcriptional regulator n=1 Tax=Novosphingobium sediminis TaxID=707214 RepID=A0A512AKP7_9SPHN|nr:helix-turn-helix transcriptional regulator [Novosphingobium sediminis]GEO00263.1 XRE family transcriptional regulator [Novosphingobium sediminis]
MDKRALAEVFRARLQSVFDRSRLSQAAFAHGIGIDRSALSLLLSGRMVRLPRVETLLAIAERHAVTIDWLLGLSEDEGVTGAMLSTGTIETTEEDGASLLMRWHAEAAGTKIRYVPARIPDLLRTTEVIAYEAAAAHQSPLAQVEDAAFRLEYNRAAGTDMECCMPLQTLEQFAAGAGIWSGLSKAGRQAQLAHMSALVEELYPSFRLFLFDGRERFSIPYTIFGSTRVAIFAGQMYLVLSSAETIRTMQRQFEGLIRHTRVHAHEAAGFVRGLKLG